LTTKHYYIQTGKRGLLSIRIGERKSPTCSPPGIRIVRLYFLLTYRLAMLVPPTFNQQSAFIILHAVPTHANKTQDLRRYSDRSSPNLSNERDDILKK